MTFSAAEMGERSQVERMKSAEANAAGSAAVVERVVPAATMPPRAAAAGTPGAAGS